MPHHRPLDRPAERCCICDEPTFRAGPSDDSLYGDKMDGPYCDKCYEPVRERDEAVRHHDTLAKAVDEYEAERQELMRQRDALREALEPCVEAIRQAPDDAFGYALDPETGESSWPIRDELLGRAAAALLTALKDS